MSDYDQSQQIRESLRTLVRKLGVLERGDASCCGVTLSQSYSIIEIGRAGSISESQLTAILGVDKSTVSKSIDKLVRDEILKRDVAPMDRRSVTLRLSDKGRSVFDEIEKRSTTYFEEVLSSLPDKKREQIIESLQYLVQALKENRCC